jgi:hypothetical protein
LAVDVVSLNAKEIQEALDQALGDVVASLFKALFGNLVETTAPAPARDALTADQAKAAFARSFKMACECHEFASAKAAEIVKG